jgi:hypothetical protein
MLLKLFVGVVDTKLLKTVDLRSLSCNIIIAQTSKDSNPKMSNMPMKDSVFFVTRVALIFFMSQSNIFAYRVLARASLVDTASSTLSGIVYTL